MGAIDDRKEYSLRRMGDLKQALLGARKITGTKACVFASGSFGRLEASEHSDLDPCIVALSTRKKGSKLSLLQEIRLKSEIILAVERLGLKEIDGDGKYIGQFTDRSLVDEIGSPIDDSNNTFTTRLLMLLEAKPLTNEDIFNKVRRDIVEAYWVDFDRYQNKFVPAYFTNDIIRLWRTFCVNYEARTRKLVGDLRIKKKVKNYKLKHSRILTCYSAILYLLSIYSTNGTVTQSNAIEMCAMTPMERLFSLRGNSDISHARGTIDNLIEMYDRFLHTASQETARLEQQIQDNKGYMRDDYKFGQEMFNAINSIGGGNEFHRLIIV
ncbi:hypothetical protein [Mesorhizobium sp. B2-3-15]|uniref:hypothetical protein n=1 Tax=Mesorhizobium sp. B2-3-15 TaxID=2589949 RepID=UPI00112CB328|nr:hypothetical protein [Mesorhizobium sp. B2-3-15]TPL65179.1 hypothetical protein FJ954_28280 [Mesorhizobium sp. B2-3-15]